MDLLGVDLEPALRQLYGRLPSAGRLEPLRGDASSRRYYRLHVDEPVPAGAPTRLMVMQLPADALGSDEKTATRPTELPFLDVQRMLAARGLPVPAVYLADVAHRVVLLEDLGDETFHARLQRQPASAWLADYEAAVQLLARMHRECAAGQPDESVAFRRRFDRELLRWELDHFREWGLEAPGVQLSTSERTTLDQCFDQLVDELLTIPTGFVHRDYQSKNLMWASPERLVLIDFQDALWGPRPYDLVALLCDSYVALDAGQQDALIDTYLDAMQLPAAERPQFRRELWRVAAQRKLKDAGRFVFIDRVRANPDFLKWFPQTMRYVERALRELPSLEPVRALLVAHVPGYPDRVAVPEPRTGSARPTM
jgi:aminoglycoside/choline kinase family phosphotransferase